MKFWDKHFCEQQLSPRWIRSFNASCSANANLPNEAISQVKFYICAYRHRYLQMRWEAFGCYKFIFTSKPLHTLRWTKPNVQHLNREECRLKWLNKRSRTSFITCKPCAILKSGLLRQLIEATFPRTLPPRWGHSWMARLFRVFVKCPPKISAKSSIYLKYCESLW